VTPPPEVGTDTPLPEVGIDTPPRKVGTGVRGLTVVVEGLIGVEVEVAAGAEVDAIIGTVPEGGAERAGGAVDGFAAPSMTVTMSVTTVAIDANNAQNSRCRGLSAPSTNLVDNRIRAPHRLPNCPCIF
jgi:hypothetical protein